MKATTSALNGQRLRRRVQEQRRRPKIGGQSPDQQMPSQPSTAISSTPQDSSLYIPQLPDLPRTALCLNNSKIHRNRKAALGLQNLGNTCYLNAILQCLGALPEFVAAVIGSSTQQQQQTEKTGVLQALADLFRRMWSADHLQAVLSPERVLNGLANLDDRWCNGEQHDAQEALHCLMQALEIDTADEERRPGFCRSSSLSELSEFQQAEKAWQWETGLRNTILNSICGGLLQSTISCSACHSHSHSFEYFLDLSLSLPKKSSSVTLQDCIEMFTAAEKLPAANGYFCRCCQKCQAASKQLHFVRLPPILILNLKRFTTSRLPLGVTTVSKDTSSVRAPVDSLRLVKHCSDTPGARERVNAEVYDLISICHHHGSLSSGHYTATCRSVSQAGEDSWVEFNDAEVVEQKSLREASRSAYLLFYRRRQPQSTAGAA